MTKRLLGLLALSLLFAATARAQVGVVPVSALGQHIVARNYLGVTCGTNPPVFTGLGTAALYFPWLVGIPEEHLFDSETVRDQTTARFTAVFSNIELGPPTTNGDMTNSFFAPGHDVIFYYQEHPTSDQDWTKFDSFKDGQHIATFRVTKNMISQIGGIGFFINSAPLIFSDDFVLPDGKVYNFRKLVPGGITVHVLASFTLAGVHGPISQLDGACALMFPFSGTGIHQSATTLPAAAASVK